MHLPGSIVCITTSFGDIPRTTVWTSGNHKKYKMKQVEETSYVVPGSSRISFTQLPLIHYIKSEKPRYLNNRFIHKYCSSSFTIHHAA